MNIHCLHCGTDLPDIAIFCLKCGKAVENKLDNNTEEEELIKIDNENIKVGETVFQKADTKTEFPQERRLTGKRAPSHRSPVRHSKPLNTDASSLHTSHPLKRYPQTRRTRTPNTGVPSRNAIMPLPRPRLLNTDTPDYINLEEDDYEIYETPPPPRKSSLNRTTRKLKEAPPPPRKSPLNRTTRKLVANIRDADPSNTREVATSQLELIIRYHNNVLKQAQQSFYWALIAAGLGLIFFIAAVALFILKQPTSVAIISSIGGALVYVISGINFYLYGRASNQFAAFHVYLDRTHRFLLADSVCENVKDDQKRDLTRSELVKTIIADSASQTLEPGRLNGRKKSIKINLPKEQTLEVGPE